MPTKNKRKEQLKFEISKCTIKEWTYYKKYHYLSENIPPNGINYEMKLGNKKIGFLQIRKFMHPIAKDILTISRIVIVPEFQGFGLGIKFMNIIANLHNNFRIRIVTSLKPFIIALSKNKDWKCLRLDRSSKQKIMPINNRITATFQWKGHFE